MNSYMRKSGCEYVYFYIFYKCDCLFLHHLELEKFNIFDWTPILEELLNIFILIIEHSFYNQFVGMHLFLINLCCDSLNLDKLSISMPETICEITSKSLGETPIHCSFPMTLIILILSTIKDIFRPIEFTFSLHFTFLPFSAIAFSIEPCIYSLSVELVVYEVAFIALEKFDPSMMFKEEIFIICKPCFWKFWIFPLQLLL